MKVTALHIYPIKGAAGIPLSTAEVDRFGFVHDRRWMLVSPDGRFISQREEPRLALLRPSLEPDALTVEAPDVPLLRIPIDPGRKEAGVSGRACAPRRDGSGVATVRIWSDAVEAETVSSEADAWFTRYLGSSSSLVHIPPASGRTIDPAHGDPSPLDPDGARVSFADGFPFLLLSEESLDELNRRLGAAGRIRMNRFRPNIVVRSGGLPHDEDGWRTVRIGEVEFHVAKPCARCVVTTVDQESGVAGREPLRTLAEYRRASGSGGVFFGQNLTHRTLGSVRVGDRVQVLEAGARIPETIETETKQGAFK